MTIRLQINSRDSGGASQSSVQEIKEETMQDAHGLKRTFTCTVKAFGQQQQQQQRRRLSSCDLLEVSVFILFIIGRPLGEVRNEGRTWRKMV